LWALAAALPSASAVAQAGGLKTAFEFNLPATVSMDDEGSAALRRVSRFDLVQAWRNLHPGSVGLVVPWARAEFVTGTGPLSLADNSLRSVSSDAFASPLAFEAARYRLESGRVTLRAAVYEDESWTIRLGATAVSSPQTVGLASVGGLSAAGARVGLGLAPMWHASAERRLTDRWSLIGDLNIGAGRPTWSGQPVDMALRAAYDWDRDWSLLGGYRLVDARSGSVPDLTGLGGVNRIQTLTFGVRRSF
jgi:hypothetical protein